MHLNVKKLGVTRKVQRLIKLRKIKPDNQLSGLL